MESKKTWEGKVLYFCEVFSIVTRCFIFYKFLPLYQNLNLIRENNVHFICIDSFYTSIFEHQFKQCMEFPAQHRFSIAFPMVCSHFMQVGRELWYKQTLSLLFTTNLEKILIDLKKKKRFIKKKKKKIEEIHLILGVFLMGQIYTYCTIFLNTFKP